MLGVHFLPAVLKNVFFHDRGPGCGSMEDSEGQSWVSRACSKDVGESSVRAYSDCPLIDHLKYDQEKKTQLRY